MDGVIPLVVALILGLAVWRDVVDEKIPNVLTIGALLVGVAAQFLLGGVDGLRTAIAGAAVGFGCLLPLYLLKGTGAGDVKLMAAVGAFLGPGATFLAVLLTLVAGGIVAIALVVSRTAGSRRQFVEAPLTDGRAVDVAPPSWSSIRKERFPYAVAIAIGTIAAMSISNWVWRSVLV